MENQNTARRRFTPTQLGVLVLLILSVAVMLKTLFVGLEIDEEYALSIGFRIVKGDTLFYTMWEPHQLSALTAAALVALFMKITGSTTGVLLFVRVCMLAAKALLSYVFYREFKRRLGPCGAMLGALVLFLYTPKWFLGPDYICQQFHYTVAAFLVFYDYYTHNFRRPWQLVFGAVCLSLSFLAFPQSVLAAPVVFIGMIVLGVRREERRFLKIPRGAWLMLLGCVLSAAVFLIYLLHGVPLGILPRRIALILNDPQYNFTTLQRLQTLLGQLLNVAAFLVKPMLLALAFAAYGCIRGIRRREVRNIRYWLNIFLAAWAGLTILSCLLRAVRDSSPDERYFCLVLALAGVWFFRGGKGTEREPLFWLGYLPGIAAYLFILRSTLLGFAPTFMYLSWPAFCALLALYLQVKEAAGGERNPTTPFAVEAVWPRGLMLCLIAFLLVCRALLVLTTGWGANNIFNTPLRLLTTGPAACTWVDADTADMYTALETALAPYGGKKILLSTGDVHGLAFLMNDGTMQVGQASVISSTDSDNRFAAYYNELPDKTPEVIVYNLDSVRDLDQFHQWLEDNLTISGRHTTVVGSARLEVLTVKEGSLPPAADAANGTAQNTAAVTGINS